MKSIILVITALLPNLVFGLIETEKAMNNSHVALEAVERMRSFSQSMEEMDETIPEGMAILKFNLNELDADIQYKVKNGGTWSHWNFYQKNKEKVLVDTLPAGTYQFKFQKLGHDQVYGNLTIKSQYFVEANVHLYINNQNNIKRVLKPAIYLYSDEAVELNIKVSPAGKFDFTYPIHQDIGWDVHVDQNGMTCNGASYDYLFWDATLDKMDFNYNFGFVFKGEESTSFLEEKLSTLGLNDREKQDFIAFWGPKLSLNEFNYVHFICDEAYSETIGGIESSKEFDSSLRIFMGYKALSDPISVIEQDLESFKRNGLTLVEWGGGEVFIQQLGL